MTVNCVVLDSGVFAKIFLSEEDREQALALLHHIRQKHIQVICPDIFLYEVLSIAATNGYSLDKALDSIRSFEKAGLTLQPLTPPQLQLAMRMAEDGHPKTGYPSIYDSAYHALAIYYQGMFVTADKRHVAKAHKHGHVTLLKDWESLV